MLCKIIPEKCIACGLCQLKAPDVFDYYDNGIVRFKDSEQLEVNFKDPLPEEILTAYQKCPTRAIELKK
ncbi:ferredoxin [Vagococcus bubulae]|uniref:Ferredoxin n=1 Tax=Vagococcus bubulae TaxID=1977868 RepID=A0A429ZIH6_9ENTE|nr:ferredoxin [Vagococcus bubulae]RST93491.1 ferredoxin [Vagococcus bubulae]